MKKLIVYQCDFCSIRSLNYKKILRCEAAHLGLTPQELITYTNILEGIKVYTHIVDREDSKEAREKLLIYINELKNFEKEYKIEHTIIEEQERE